MTLGNRNFSRREILALIAAGLGGALFVLEHYSDKPIVEPIYQLIGALAVAFLVVFSVAIYMVVTRLEDVDLPGKVEENKQEIAQLKLNAEALLRERKITTENARKFQRALDKVQPRSPTIDRIGEMTLEVFLADVFRAEESGITIVGHQMSFLLYTRLWRYLTEKQFQREESPILIRIVHGTDWKIWNSAEGKSFMALQKKFLKEGGDIRRVMIGSDRIGSVKYEANILPILRDLKEAARGLYYLCTADPVFKTVGVRKERSEDLLWIEELDYLQRWQAPKRGASINQTVIGVRDKDRQIGRWANFGALLRKCGEKSVFHEEEGLNPDPRWPR